MSDIEKQASFIIRARDESSKVVKDMAKKSAGALTLLVNAFRALEKIALGFIVAIGWKMVSAFKKYVKVTYDLVRSSIDVADSFEQLQIQLKVMYGSAEKGIEAFNELWVVARQLPGTIQEIGQSARNLKAWDVIGKDVKQSIIAVSDAAAVAGINIEEMSVILGRAWQQGQFWARGPGSLLKGLMETKMGVNTLTMSLYDFRVALAKLLTDPQYGVAGMSQQLAGTFSGLKSMISDAMTNIKYEIARSGLFDSVKEMLKDVLKILQLPSVIRGFKEFGTIAMDVIDKLRLKIRSLAASGVLLQMLDDWRFNFQKMADFAVVLIDHIPHLVKAFQNAFTSAIAIAEQFARALGTIVSWINKISGATADVERELGGAAKRVQELRSPLEHLIAASGAVDAALSKSGHIGMEPLKAIELTAALLENGALTYEDYLRLSKTYGEVEIARVSKQVDWTTKLLEANKDLQRVLKGGILLAQNNPDLIAANKEVDRLAKKLKEFEEGFSFSVDFDFKTPDIAAQENKITSKFDSLMSAIGDKAVTFFNMIKVKWQEAFNIGAPDPRTVTEQFEDYLKQLDELNHKISDITTSTAKAMASSFEDFFFDVMVGDFEDMRDYLISFGREMARIIAQQAAMKATMALFPTSAVVPVGQAGTPAVQKQHGGIVRGGGGIDTIPVMATPGELYLNKMQQSNLFNMIKSGSGMGGGGGGGSTIINITAMDSQDVFRAITKDPRLMGAIQAKGRLLNRRGV